jgi:hypothetical protein
MGRTPDQASAGRSPQRLTLDTAGPGDPGELGDGAAAADAGLGDVDDNIGAVARARLRRRLPLRQQHV